MIYFDYNSFLKHWLALVFISVLPAILGSLTSFTYSFKEENFFYTWLGFCLFLTSLLLSSYGLCNIDEKLSNVYIILMGVFPFSFSLVSTFIVINSLETVFNYLNSFFFLLALIPLPIFWKSGYPLLLSL